jgi:hypothetical protein
MMSMKLKAHDQKLAETRTKNGKYLTNKVVMVRGKRIGGRKGDLLATPEKQHTRTSCMMIRRHRVEKKLEIITQKTGQQTIR